MNFDKCIKCSATASVITNGESATITCKNHQCDARPFTAHVPAHRDESVCPRSELDKYHEKQTRMQASLNDYCKKYDHAQEDALIFDRKSFSIVTPKLSYEPSALQALAPKTNNFLLQADYAQLESQALRSFLCAHDPKLLRVHDEVITTAPPEYLETARMKAWWCGICGEGQMHGASGEIWKPGDACCECGAKQGKDGDWEEQEEPIDWAEGDFPERGRQPHRAP